MGLLSEEILPNRWKQQYREGKLFGCIKFLEKMGVKSSDILKCGSTCVVFNHTGNRVIKLTTKDIHYFRYFATNNTLRDFHNVVCNTYNSVFLPIKEVLYEDQNYFIYTQDKINILNLIDIDAGVFIKILELVKRMHQVGIITPDIISSNLGFYQGATPQQLMLLDYHDLKPMSRHAKEEKWIKIARCLMEFSSWLLYKKSFEEKFGQSLTEWKDAKSMKKKKYGEKHLPGVIVNIIKALAKGDNKLICHTISDCQMRLSKLSK